MKVYMDLHIHSALSPCADKDMTPNDIVNMAYLKGLDMIAVTDHNSVENIRAVLRCSADKNITIIPGMEVETREEVHLICLFPDLQAALSMQDIVYQSLPALKNREDIFGEQLILDENDHVVGHLERLLMTASGLGVEDVYTAVKDLGGAVIPAHIDRESYSLLSNLGFVPSDLNIKYLEISKKCNRDEFITKNPALKHYRFLRSSDAHTLGDILERECYLDLEEMSIQSLLKELKELS